MIETFTPVKIRVAGSLPAKPPVTVVLTMSSDKPTESRVADSLDAPALAGLTALRAAKLLPVKANEIRVQALDGSAGRKLVAVSLGAKEKVTSQTYREAAGVLARVARKHAWSHLSVVLPAALPGGSHDIAAAFATGLCTGFFRFERFKSRKEKSARESLDATLVVDPAAVSASRLAADRAAVVAESQNLARSVAATPGNVMNPPALAELARSVAKSSGMTCKVLDEKQMARLGMGGMLAVGAASATPPRMIVLEWKGGKAKQPLMLVGKAITFDTGGISIKPAERMHKMVYDKCGAMAVLGAMHAIARLKLPVHVVAVLASAENHVGGTGYRPGDILTMYNGLTVEITNTDAEGRLVLGDALAWGIETYKPAAVIDLATLTGGCVVALGNLFAGLMTNDLKFAAEVSASASEAGENVWLLPQGPGVDEMLKGDHSDLINSAGRHASPLTGGAFVGHFVPRDGSVPWVHLDIAGVADSDKDSPLYAKGATGFGVRTLVNWVLSRSTK